MTTYSEHEQRVLDQYSGEELDRVQQQQQQRAKEAEQLAIIAENTVQAAVFANDFSIVPLGGEMARFVFMERPLPQLPRQSRAAIILADDLVFSIADAIGKYRELKTKQKAAMLVNAVVEGSA